MERKAALIIKEISLGLGIIFSSISIWMLFTIIPMLVS